MSALGARCARRKNTRNRSVAKACFILEIFATDFVSLTFSILPILPLLPIEA